RVRLPPVQGDGEEARPEEGAERGPQADRDQAAGGQALAGPGGLPEGAQGQGADPGERGHLALGPAEIQGGRRTQAGRTVIVGSPMKRVVGVVAVTAAVAFGPAARAELVDRVAAVVNNDVITLSEVEQRAIPLL